MLLAAKLFFGKYWKIIVPVILAGLAIWGAISWINNIKEEAYNNGVVATDNKWEDKIAKENEANRKFEETLRDIVGEFGQQAVEEAIARTETTVIHQEKIREIIRNNPIYKECKIDPQVLDARNQIRALGPTGATSSTTREDGSVRVEFSQ